MKRLGLETDVVDEDVYRRTVERFRASEIVLPTFSELATPTTIPAAVGDRLSSVDPDGRDPWNLFRVHWHNARDRRSLTDVPVYTVLPEALTGVPSPILVILGDRFPMITAHKVLAAYACLVPRLVTGQFDADSQRAIWPSTGNYCRGGIAISRILDCRGVAVLPEGMSAERFEWLEKWVVDSTDIVRTPGTESNVKEIYDACNALEQDAQNVIFNQFCEFGNYLAHYTCTGQALERVFLDAQKSRPGLQLAGYASATGSAGTLGAGDYLKERFGSRNVAVEALECPTLLYNGFGEHNIQGIGDKHVPLIHNVTNTDVVTGISDRSTDALNVLFNTDVGRNWLARERGIDDALLEDLRSFGLSSICNVLASIKLSKRLGLGSDSAVITVATDGASLYRTELEKTQAKVFAGGFDDEVAARTYEEHLGSVTDDHLLELGPLDRDRIFNLGYFTWVEQQGVTLADFEARRSQDFWQGLRAKVPAWDERIRAFNAESGAQT